MDFRICILLVSAVLSYSESCSLTYDNNECQYNMLCINTIDDTQGWERFRSRHRAYDPTGVTACSRIPPITYGGYTLDTVNLVMKVDDTSSPVPISYYWGAQGYLNAIYSLDLSENQYVNTPNLKSMQNLAKLKISRNQLTTAVLSNVNELNKLEEIDLSYNKIINIEVQSSAHPYSMLTKMNISQNNLVNIPDAVFDRFDDLQTLDLSYNFIEELGPLTFEGVKNLLHLNLSDNKLTDINSSLFRFSELKLLSLSNNKINSLKFSDFEKLNKLELLDLSSNSIKTIDHNVFQNLVLLCSLDLSNNFLEGMSTEMLANSQSLSSIDLSENKFKYLPKGLFKNKTVYTFSISFNFLEGSLIKGMFEGINITKLDLNNQLLTAIEDYAFYDLTILDTLLLDGNGIRSLSNMCFKTLLNLKLLDLSNNQITSLDFNKEDLSNLRTLMLKNNRLIQIKQEHIRDLNNLEFLDLSGNAISRLEPSSFHSLRNLVNLQISSNPLSGTLETDTFEGLLLLPSLDISHNLLTTVHNASFNNMNELKELNMSRSKIKELQYNAFVHTGFIVTLDLSYNKIENIFINTTDLVRLTTLLLNNNLLKAIAPTLLHGLSELNKISLATNILQNLDNELFKDLINLSFLDLSNNKKLNFTVELLKKNEKLGTLVLSGVRTKINFAHLEDLSITKVLITDASLYNISMLNLRNLKHVNNIVLSHNNISKIETGAFSDIGTLTYLDLSYNKISFIQPGTFKDNILLVSLNISYNSLSVIGYGILRGLNHLKILDISYNNIKDLQIERFYEVKSLSELIVDHNKIDSVNVEEFIETSLSKLSIGDNPLPCQVLVKIKANKTSFKITAIKLDEHSGENIDGVTCNKERKLEPQLKSDTIIDNKDIFVDMRNILYRISNKNTVEDSNDLKYLENIKNVLETSNSMNNEKLSRIIELNNDTNMLFKVLLQSFDRNNSNIQTTSRPVLGTNTSISGSVFGGNVATSSIDPNNNIDLIPYINNIKKDLKRTIADEKQSIINELETKLNSIYKNYEKESLFTSPSNEHLEPDIVGTKSLFTEICMALILLILVGFVVYKIYKSRLFLRNRSSISTRELPDAMDNSAL